MAANFTRRSRHDSVYYFRRRVPNDLHALGLPRQIVRSMHTADLRESVVRARALAAATDNMFSRIRAMAKSNGFKERFIVSLDVDDEGKPTKWTVNAEPHEVEAAKEVLRTLIAASTASAQGTPAPAEAKVATVPASKSKSIAEALTLYWAESTLAPSSKQRYESILRHVEKHFGAHMRLSEITQERFADYSGLVKANPKWKPATQNSYITVGRVFLEWCANRFDEGIHISASTLKSKRTTSPDEDRAAFTISELRIVLQAVRVNMETEPQEFWVTALAIFTGARLEEITQLHISEDIGKDPDSEFWFIHIRDGKDRRVKRFASRRHIPLHPALIEAGFLDYVEGLKAKGESRQLFPKWEPLLNKKHGGKKFGHYVGKWGKLQLDRLRAEGKITRPKLTYFHSARHAVANTLKQNLANESLQSALTGHSYGGITNNRYGKRYAIKTLGELLIEKLPEYAELIGRNT